jgi:hypothetical protein
LKLWASPQFFYYDFYWPFNLIVLTFSSGATYLFFSKSEFTFRLSSRKSKYIDIENFYINFC